MLPSIIRTYVPLLVSFVASWLLSLGIEIDDSQRGLLVSGLGSLIAAGYYAAARLLERKFPGATWLLGSAYQPTRYAEAAPTAIDAPAELRTYVTGGEPRQDLVTDMSHAEALARLKHPAGSGIPTPRDHPDYPA